MGGRNDFKGLICLKSTIDSNQPSIFFTLFSDGLIAVIYFGNMF